MRFTLAELLVTASIVVVGVLVVGGLVTVLVWLLYPTVVAAVFPGLVASGAVAAKLSFWDSFWLAILCSVLFKSHNISSK